MLIFSGLQGSCKFLNAKFNTFSILFPNYFSYFFRTQTVKKETKNGLQSAASEKIAKT